MADHFTIDVTEPGYDRPAPAGQNGTDGYNGMAGLPGGNGTGGWNGANGMQGRPGNTALLNFTEIKGRMIINAWGGRGQDGGNGGRGGNGGSGNPGGVGGDGGAPGNGGSGATVRVFIYGPDIPVEINTGPALPGKPGEGGEGGNGNPTGGKGRRADDGVEGSRSIVEITFVH